MVEADSMTQDAQTEFKHLESARDTERLTPSVRFESDGKTVVAVFQRHEDTGEDDAPIRDYIILYANGTTTHVNNPEANCIKTEKGNQHPFPWGSDRYFHSTDEPFKTSCAICETELESGTTTLSGPHQNLYCSYECGQKGIAKHATL